MSRVRNRAPRRDADLDITAFMNLMIVLVPILLLGLVFSRITVVDINLPDLAQNTGDSDNKQLELIVRKQELQLNYPQGVLLKKLPLNDSGEQDFALLSLVLQEVKRQLRDKGIDNRSIILLPESEVDYQTLVSTVDTVRSFKTLVAASVVDAELFPEIAFGSAPQATAEKIL